MSRTRPAQPRTSKRSRTTMNLDRSKIRRVRHVLGTKTDMEAVDRALDVVLANAEIEAAIAEAFEQSPDFNVQ